MFESMTRSNRPAKRRYHSHCRDAHGNPARCTGRKSRWAK